MSVNGEPTSCCIFTLAVRQPPVLAPCIEIYYYSRNNICFLFVLISPVYFYYWSQLHAAALSSLRSEVSELNSRLLVATRARESAEAALIRAESQAIRAEQRAEQQSFRHEERLTELHSVIAELGRQLERHRATVIAEEDESGQSRQYCQGRLLFAVFPY